MFKIGDEVVCVDVEFTDGMLDHMCSYVIQDIDEGGFINIGGQHYWIPDRFVLDKR